MDTGSGTSTAENGLRDKIEALPHGPISAASTRPRSWGDGCLSWDLIDRDDMLLVEEVMPPSTQEVAHRHLLARQVFFVLSGTLEIEMSGTTTRITQHEACEVSPGRSHQVFNRTTSDVHFLAFAHPTTKGDRVAAS